MCWPGTSFSQARPGFSLSRSSKLSAFCREMSQQVSPVLIWYGRAGVVQWTASAESCDNEEDTTRKMRSRTTTTMRKKGKRECQGLWLLN